MPRRTEADVRALAELYESRDELDDVHRFEDAPDNPFPIVDIRNDRLDRLINHGWVGVDMREGDAWLTYSGFAIGRTANTYPELVEELSVPDFVEKAGAKNGLKL